MSRAFGIPSVPVGIFDPDASITGGAWSMVSPVILRAGEAGWLPGAVIPSSLLKIWLPPACDVGASAVIGSPGSMLVRSSTAASYFVLSSL